ncbi:MAG: hypothetical protein WCJ19_04500 [bacterium]
MPSREPNGKSEPSEQQLNAVERFKATQQAIEEVGKAYVESHKPTTPNPVQQPRKTNTFSKQSSEKSKIGCGMLILPVAIIALFGVALSSNSGKKIENITPVPATAPVPTSRLDYMLVRVSGVDTPLELGNMTTNYEGSKATNCSLVVYKNVKTNISGKEVVLRLAQFIAPFPPIDYGNEKEISLKYVDYADLTFDNDGKKIGSVKGTCGVKDPFTYAGGFLPASGTKPVK